MAETNTNDLGNKIVDFEVLKHFKEQNVDHLQQQVAGLEALGLYVDEDGDICQKDE